MNISITKQKKNVLGRELVLNCFEASMNFRTSGHGSHKTLTYLDIYISKDTKTPRLDRKCTLFNNY